MCYIKSRIPKMCQPQIRNSWNVLPQIEKTPKCGSSNQEFLKCATWFELAHFGNSQFVVAHFRNSSIELAHFEISWFVAAHFRNSLSLDLLNFFLENFVFLACFQLLWISFWILTLIHSDDMDILQKELVQNAYSCVKLKLKHFSTTYMQLPPPAVFHDKSKRTQQGNLLGQES